MKYFIQMAVVLVLWIAVRAQRTGKLLKHILQKIGNVYKGLRQSGGNVEKSIKYLYFAGYIFVQRTLNDCSVTKGGKDYISGLTKEGTNPGRIFCETKCKEYSWCKGIRISPYWGICYLLTESDQPTMSGWKFEGKRSGKLGNMFPWAEPNEWKNGKTNAFVCYSKEAKGVYPIKRSICKTIPYIVWIINVYLRL